MFTDPPYNVPISGHVGGLGTIQHREFAMASGEMSQAEFTVETFRTPIPSTPSFYFGATVDRDRVSPAGAGRADGGPS